MKLFALFRTSVSFLGLLLVPLGLPAPSGVPVVAMEVKQQQSLSSVEIANQFIDFLSSGEYEQARSLLHADLQSQWPIEEIEKLWSELVETTGYAKQRLESRSTESLGAELVFVDVEFQDRTEQLLVIVNQDQQIIGVDFPRTETIEQITEKIVSALVREDFAQVRGYLHPYLKTEIFPQQIEEKWQRLLDRTGSYQRNLGMEVKSGSDLENVEIVSVTLEFEQVTEQLIVIFNHQKQVIGVDFPQID